MHSSVPQGTSELQTFKDYSLKFSWSTLQKGSFSQIQHLCPVTLCIVPHLKALICLYLEIRSQGYNSTLRIRLIQLKSTILLNSKSLMRNAYFRSGLYLSKNTSFDI